jgi:DNA adenine methylase
MIPKPFLKWAGGKTQLLDELEQRLPSPIKESRTIKSYIEPFVGGGAMFFYLEGKYTIEESLLMDRNQELLVAYHVLRDDHQRLKKFLARIETRHLDKDEPGRKENYYHIRDTYNHQMQDFDYQHPQGNWVERTGYLIFLNKTCYNGLFRQNNKGEFNVPFGRYKNPKICDEENLIAVHKALQNTKLLSADFTCAQKYIDKGTLVYMDPPYRPLNRTSHFTDYSAGGFTDHDQERLALFYQDMDKKGAYLLLSNSDPQNEDPQDHFFDRMYRNFHLDRVAAKRNINSNPGGRGEIKELIIRNYIP